jgi:hypothetical protein
MCRAVKLQADSSGGTLAGDAAFGAEIAGTHRSSCSSMERFIFSLVEKLDSFYPHSKLLGLHRKAERSNVDGLVL